MSLTSKQEAYCQAVADGLKELDALKQVGYNPQSAGKQLYRLQDNQAVQDRIAELKAINLINASDAASGDAKVDAKITEKLSAMDFLRDTINNPQQSMKVRIAAAIAVLPYEKSKLAPKGKKEDAVDTAKQATKSGRFSTFSNQDFFDSDSMQ
ncbi:MULTISPECIES: hypothetical protein [unclassified Acinetobacter]|uniref:hypothetical protein n=1 Tax=unclassified Acinetobacter TaxID=196816 RepID=UPI0035B99712